MAAERGSGTTALDRLRTHYDNVDMTCPECGYEDRDGSWQSRISGNRIDYRHLCPSCGALRRRTIQLD